MKYEEWIDEIFNRPEKVQEMGRQDLFFFLKYLDKSCIKITPAEDFNGVEMTRIEFDRQRFFKTNMVRRYVSGEYEIRKVDPFNRRRLIEFLIMPEDRKRAFIEKLRQVYQYERSSGVARLIIALYRCGVIYDPREGLTQPLIEAMKKDLGYDMSRISIIKTTTWRSFASGYTVDVSDVMDRITEIYETV